MTPPPRLADHPPAGRRIVLALLEAERAALLRSDSKAELAATADLSPAGGPPLLRPGETSTARPVESPPMPTPAPSAAPPARAGGRRARVTA